MRMLQGPDLKLQLFLQSMGEVFSSLMAAVGAADKVLELIRRQPQIVPVANLKPDQFVGTLALEHIVFSYPARPDSTVLSDLSFTMKPGEVRNLVRRERVCQFIFATSVHAVRI